MRLEDIGKRRKNLGLTQTDLAKLANVSQSMIAKIERGLISPSYENAKRIFDSLDKLEHETGTRAFDIMTKKVISVGADDKVGKAIDAMEKYGISQLPVLKNKRIVGTVSESAILKLLKEKNLGSMQVREIMEDAPPTIAEDSPLSLVSEMLNYNSLLLVLKKGEISGVVTKSNLLKVVK